MTAKVIIEKRKGEPNPEYWERVKRESAERGLDPYAVLYDSIRDEQSKRA